MESPYDRVFSGFAALSEVSHWANSLSLLDPESAIGSRYKYKDFEEFKDLRDEELWEDLKDGGLICYADMHPDIEAAYDWKLARRVMEEGETPLTVALVVASELASLSVMYLIRALDALPENCIWRDQMRRDLRIEFAKIYPLDDGTFRSEKEARDVPFREFLEEISKLNDQFGLRLSGLVLLEQELASGPSKHRNRLWPHDYHLLQAMRELGADKNPKPTLDIMQTADRKGDGKRAFVRLKGNDMVEPTAQGYLLLPLGLRALEEHEAKEE